jgi:hypothetical protein
MVKREAGGLLRLNAERLKGFLNFLAVEQQRE